MTNLYSEHVNELARFIMSRIIYRRLRTRPEVIEHVARRLDRAIRKAGDNVAWYATEWQSVIRDPAAVCKMMIGNSEMAMRLRTASPFQADDVGLDFTEIEWRKRVYRAARRIAAKEVQHGRTWSICGFQMFTAYPSPESGPDFCSFEEIKRMSGRDGVLVLRAMKARKIRSYRRRDVEAYAARQAEIDQLMTEISADH